MIKRKLAASGCVMALTLALVTGCGSDNTTADNDSTSSVSSEEATSESSDNSGTQTVRVTAIDGTTVTAETIGMSFGKDDARPSGEPERGDADAEPPQGRGTPEQPDSSAEPPQGSGKPEQLDSSAEPPQESGAPDSDGKMSEKAAGEGTTITFTITDTTEITVESDAGNQEGSSADITEDSILEITLDEDNQATAVVVKQDQQQEQE